MPLAMDEYHTAILAALYDGLATPPLSPRPVDSPIVTRAIPRLMPRGVVPPCDRVSPISTTLATPTARSLNDTYWNVNRITINLDDNVNHDLPDFASPIPVGSLLPNKIPHAHRPSKPSLPDLYVDTTDSLTREKKGKMPALSHLLSVGKGRVLSLAADDEHVYAGCQSADNEIVVFSRSSLQPMFRLLGHQGSVLSLLVVQEKEWLASSSSSGDVRIWCTKTLQPIYIIHPCDDTSGDVYSLAWDSRSGGTLYLGSQAATIEWVNFAEPTSPQARPHRTRKPSLPTASASKTVAVGEAKTDSSSNGSNGMETPTRPSLRTGRYRPHSFFDNPPSATPSGASTPRSHVPGSTAQCCSRPPSAAADTSRSAYDTPTSRAISASSTDADSDVLEIEIAVESRLAFAHFGYVYALSLVNRSDGTRWLVSGSGDSDVKIWEAHPSGGLTLIHHFAGLHGAVQSFAVRDSLLFAGLQDGEIKVWDLETGACIRSIQAHVADVLTMSVLGDDVFTSAADGRVLRVDGDFDCTAAWRAHAGIILSSTIVRAKDRWEFITAGNDSYVKIWTIDLPRFKEREELDVEGEGDVMLYALSKMVAVPTVSDEAHRESCRQGAHLLKKILQQLGASSEVISGEEGRNPLVLATFSGKDIGRSRKRLLFYGHYDVQPAQESGWETDPWTLSGRNGYLYGRGVSDNKGPILAVACAAAALRQRRELDVDLVMLIEGEEEAGSRGFASTVRKHKETIGHIDAVLLSNSTWIDEDDPCVVFGMRGVLYANLSISSRGDDAHSGVDGGAVAEPMFDMVKVLDAIADRQAVKLPGFYEQVRPKTQEEMDILQAVSEASSRSVEDLVKVWREPSFSIANITSSSAMNKTVIPRQVSADISIRLVPDQDLSAITSSLVDFCQDKFASLESQNQFEIHVTHSASWWLTSLDSPYFRALEAAVEDVWGVKPLKIREGGTVPTIFWLEQEFGAPCVHLPLGQASDAGHLANERMRLLNLRNGKRVVESYLSRLSTI